MTIGRTDDPENPFRAPAFEAAVLLGAGSRTPSGPADMAPRQEGRTHDRNRPTRQVSHFFSCVQGAVHTCTEEGRESGRTQEPRPICYSSYTDTVRGSVRFKAAAAMATSLASVWLVRGRSVSWITRLYRPIDASDPADYSRCIVSGWSRSAHHCTGPRRHDDGRVEMTLANRLADQVLVVAAVAGERGNGIGRWCMCGRRGRQRWFRRFCRQVSRHCVRAETSMPRPVIS